MFKLKTGEKKQIEKKWKPPKDKKGFTIFLRVLLIACLVLLMIRGAITIMSNDKQVFIHEMARLDEFIANPTKYIESDDVKAYAEGFIREYVAYNGDNRWSAGLESYFNPDGPPNFPSELKKIQVIDCRTYKVEKITPNEDTISVRVLISATKETLTDKGPVQTTEEKELFYSVYVYRGDDDKLAIVTLPTVVPKPKRAENNKLGIVSLPNADSNQTEKAKADLTSYFKAYYEGTVNDIRFLTTDKNPEVLDGQYTLKSIDKVNLYISNKGEYLSDVGLTISNDLFTQKQTFEVVLVKVDGQFKVKSIAINNKDFNPYFKTEE